jgi:hypothetical protein
MGWLTRFAWRTIAGALSMRDPLKLFEETYGMMRRAEKHPGLWVEEEFDGDEMDIVTQAVLHEGFIHEVDRNCVRVRWVGLNK